VVYVTQQGIGFQPEMMFVVFSQENDTKKFVSQYLPNMGFQKFSEHLPGAGNHFHYSKKWNIFARFGSKSFRNASAEKYSIPKVFELDS